MSGGRSIEQVNRGYGYFAANSLTMARAGLSLGAVIATSVGSPSEALGLLVVAVPTELDGTVARKYNAWSNEGAARDTIADYAWFLATYHLLLSEAPNLDSSLAIMAIPFLMITISFWVGAKNALKYGEKNPPVEW